MATKDKILAALDVTLEDVSEERLVDILLDAYRAKERQIEKLQAENAHERERLYSEREQLQEEHRRMRTDPLFCARGDYFFHVNDRKFHITVQGFKMEMYERRGGIDYAAQHIAPSDWT